MNCMRLSSPSPKNPSISFFTSHGIRMLLLAMRHPFMLAVSAIADYVRLLNSENHIAR